MKKFFLALIIFFSVSEFTFAEDAITVKSVDFKEAIVIALENNHEIRAIKNSLSASERDIGITRSFLMPKVRVGEDFISTNNPAQVFALKLNQTRLTAADFAAAPGSFNYPGNITNFLTFGMVELPVFDKKSLVSLKMAKTKYSADGYMFLRKQEELINKVAQSYLQIGTAEEYVKAAEAGVKDAREHLRIAEVRYKSELGLYSDVLRAKTQFTEAEQKLVSAKKNLNVTKKGLGTLLSLKEAVEITNKTPILDLKPIDYYKEFSMERNDIRAMRINVKNAKNGIKLAHAAWYPTLSLNASYNFYNSNYPFGGEGNNYIAGAFLHWDLFDGNKRKYDALKAKDKTKEAQEYLAALKDGIDFKVFEAFSGVEEANKNFELAQIALKSAEEGERLVMKRWQASLAPFVSVLDAQSNLNLARANLVKSSNDLKANLITLYYESGAIREELDLNNINPKG